MLEAWELRKFLIRTMLDPERPRKGPIGDPLQEAGRLPFSIGRIGEGKIEGKVGEGVEKSRYIFADNLCPHTGPEAGNVLSKHIEGLLQIFDEHDLPRPAGEGFQSERT
jgi:hypothetical protein